MEKDMRINGLHLALASKEMRADQGYVELEAEENGDGIFEWTAGATVFYSPEKWFSLAMNGVGSSPLEGLYNKLIGKSYYMPAYGSPLENKGGIIPRISEGRWRTDFSLPLIIPENPLPERQIISEERPNRGFFDDGIWGRREIRELYRTERAEIPAMPEQADRAGVESMYSKDAFRRFLEEVGRDPKKFK
ncbi:MAG TPA: hypothetical protein HA362_01125 [Nanoarchaeota archaeon]|nr:hypothetical protein [Nanoarchaeota archaeon]